LRRLRQEPGSTTIKSLELAQYVAKILDDKKANAIRIVDLRGVSSLTDYVVIASGTSGPHLKALQSELSKNLKERDGGMRQRVAGDAASAWVVLDLFDVVVHVFLPEARQYYDIEGLWKKGKEVPLA
jgi:ribosome-associated protein